MEHNFSFSHYESTIQTILYISCPYISVVLITSRFYFQQGIDFHSDKYSFGISHLAIVLKKYSFVLILHVYKYLQWFCKKKKKKDPEFCGL